MSANEKDSDFNIIVEQALKRMQESVTTSVSSSYEVHRSGGEVIVRRAGKGWFDTDSMASLVKKTGAG